MGSLSRVERIRMWLGGLLFDLAGRIHSSYDVWLDTAETRQPGQCTVTDAGYPEHLTCNGFPREDCPGYDNRG